PLMAATVLPSTMDAARRAAAAGAPVGTAVAAEEQTAGRGRRGRRFVSPRGGLYMTVLAPAPEPLALSPRAGLFAGLAVAEALEALGARVEIRWPNDLYQPQGKVGGILAELWTPAGGRAARLLVGIGIDVACDPRRTDPEAAGPGAALRGLGAADPVAAVAAEILARLPLRLGDTGSLAVRSALESLHSRMTPRPGEEATVRLANGRRIAGRTVGLDDEGALLIATGGGTTRVLTGEVVACEPRPGKGSR
ncbi:MAG: biotin--[acetyl-CoA-carboxylase] ligase, partial [Acidobacteria bacterium]